MSELGSSLNLNTPYDPSAQVGDDGLTEAERRELAERARRCPNLARFQREALREPTQADRNRVRAALTRRTHDATGEGER